MSKKDKSNAYKHRQDSKLHSELLQNESTKQNRKWEKSKIGIEKALLKIKKSRHTYI